MIIDFCHRLSLGLVAFLPLLPAKRLHPRFFRTQYLTALGLLVAAAVFGVNGASTSLQAVLLLAPVAALAASVAWSLEPPPGGTALWLATTALTATGVALAGRPGPAAIANGLTSGLLMGGAVTAMLVGHSYLISPGLEINPLIIMLKVLGLTLLARTLVLALSAFAGATPVTDDVWLFLAPRVLIGIVAALVFGALTWKTAEIHSTQSATGILYVVVICVFLGELIGMVIEQTAGLPA
jgi:hypothetical protein